MSRSGERERKRVEGREGGGLIVKVDQNMEKKDLKLFIFVCVNSLNEIVYE